jgi:simple sugar transport system permease protein
MIPRVLEGGGVGRALVSVLVGLALAGLVMQLSGYNALAAFAALGSGATGLNLGPVNSRGDLPIGPAPGVAHLDTFLLAQSLSRFTPLLLTGLAVALGLRAGLFNIGAQGQMVCGALAAAVVGLLGAEGGSKGGSWPPFLHLPATLLAGMAAGALWGALPGLLKAVRGVHEVISTILLNYIAIKFADYIVSHLVKDPKSMAVQTPLMAKSAWLPPLVPGANLTPGLALALLATVAFVLLFRRVALGFAIRAVGQGMEAARAAGIPVGPILTLTMALSGALAGLAGAIEVMGVHHRFVQGVAGSYGFDGIAVALLGGLNGGGVTLSALFFGALANGAAFMQLQTDVPDSIAILVQAVVILFVALRFRRRDTIRDQETEGTARG